VGAFRRGICENPNYQYNQLLCETLSVWNTDEEICVGWRYADSNGATTVPLMGKEGQEGTNTFTYMNPGEISYFKIYDSSNDSILYLEPSAELPGWGLNNVFTIEGTSIGTDTFDYGIELYAGANLISFYALPDDVSLANMMYSLGDNVTAVITEGAATTQTASGSWVGSLTQITASKGYWTILDSDATLYTYNATLTDPDLVYYLNSGANLISFPYNGSADIGSALPDEIEGSISGLITEGAAATQIAPGTWVGSLNSFSGGKGYWVIADEGMSFSFDFNMLGRSNIAYKEEKLTGYEYVQSSKQAFYFVESVEGINDGDWILSFNDDVVIGARLWTSSIIDVPAMGSDDSDYTKGYIETGSVPSFKILRGDELIDLEGDIPPFENNQLFMVSSLIEAIPLSETFSLDRAYPNPFNPTTTLRFAITIDSEVSLSIYNLQGREVVSLVDGGMEAGYHSVVWNADSYSSGVYFVKMVAGEFVNTQKLILIK